MSALIRTQMGEAQVHDALFGAGTSVWEWHVPSGRLTDIDTSAALLGYAPGELEPTQEAWDRVIHPDDLDTSRIPYERYLRGETPFYEVEYRAIRKDGSLCWLSERGRFVERDRDGQPLRMVGTISDVTQRKQAELARHETSELLRQLAHHVPGVLYQYRALPDGSAYFPYVSDAAEAVLGVPAAMLMRDARPVLRLIERDDRLGMQAAMQKALRSGRLWRHEFRVHPPGQGMRWIAGTATPQHEPGGTVLWHGYLHDITELRSLEHARMEAERAQAANRAKTEFLSRMSHELRTPLNAVLGFAQLLELDTAEPLTPQQGRRVAMIREAGAHLLQMIGELLDLTRIEAGQLAVQTEPLRLAPLLDEAAGLLQPQAAAADVTIAVEPPAAGLAVLADPMRLRQVLLNLVGNAVKYNRRGGSVTLRAAADGDGGVLAEVADTGVGIAPEHLPMLFEPFQRGAHERSAIEGAGIGLAITRALLALMGGSVDVTSVHGQGSTFRVRLPQAPAGTAPR